MGLVFAQIAAFAAATGNSISETTAAVGAIAVLVLGLGSLAAMVILKRLGAARDDSAAEISLDPVSAEDELAA